MGGANSCWHCSTLRPFASNSDLWSLFLGRSRCVVSSCVDTVEGRVEGRGLELCLKLCVPSISGPAALPCTPGPSLTAYTHTHTHTHTHRCTQILVVRSLGTDVCLCTCVHEHVCCECMGGGVRWLMGFFMALCERGSVNAAVEAGPRSEYDFYVF